LAGKRDSRRHPTTCFNENIVVAETSYEMLKVLSFCERDKAYTYVNNNNRLNFSGEKSKSKF